MLTFSKCGLNSYRDCYVELECESCRSKPALRLEDADYDFMENPASHGPFCLSCWIKEITNAFEDNK